MNKMILVALFALLSMIGFQSCDSGDYLGTVEFFEKYDSYFDSYRDACVAGEIEVSSDEVWQMVSDNSDRMKSGGECDVYENSEGQIIAKCNGEKCVVMKLRTPFIATIAGVGSVTMYYKAGPYYLVSSPAYTSIFTKW